MNTVGKTQIRIIKRVAAINSIMAGLSLFLAKNPLPFILGIVFGSLIGILNFRLLYLTLDKAVKMPPSKAQSYTTSRYFIRYFITGVVIYISIQAEYIHVMGTIAGLGSLKVAILASELFNSKQFFINIFRRKEGE